MLFFGPSFSHLICYFGYFCFANSVYLSKLKNKFGMLNLGQIIFGKTAVLVILIIIYVNLCDYLLSPSPGAILYVCI